MAPRRENASAAMSGAASAEMENSMLLKGANVFYQGIFHRADVRTNGKYIELIDENITPLEDEEVVKLENRLLLPGLVDIHTHGCAGYDFSNAGVEGMRKMCVEYRKKGVTSILATTMTNEYETYKQAMRNIGMIMQEQKSADSLEGARIFGINMEGPFLGADKKGAHDERYLMPVSEEVFDELDELSGNAIRLVDLDPRLEGSTEFIKKYSRWKTISLAHTSCSYEEAKNAIEAGAKHITHLFNAMNGLHHRNPGLVGAASDFQVDSEIICDGIHVAPAVLRLVFSAMPQKLVIISDSMSAAGLENGNYEIGGQKVIVKDGMATLEDGTLAGSTTNMFDEMKNLMKFGVSKENAILSASLLPAKSVGIDNICGSISRGKYADILVTTKDFDLERVIAGGMIL